MNLKVWFSRLSPTWQHALAGLLVGGAVVDEAASQWLAAGHSLPFHITAGLLAAVGWWLASAEQSILGSSSDSTSTSEKVG